METLHFDGYVEVLRHRLFDYEAVHNDNRLPDFAELMGDYADTAPEGWAVQAYEELLAVGHLNPNLSGVSMGPMAHGQLSADGRAYVRQQQRQED